MNKLQKNYNLIEKYLQLNLQAGKILTVEDVLTSLTIEASIQEAFSVFRIRSQDKKIMFLLNNFKFWVVGANNDQLLTHGLHKQVNGQGCYCYYDINTNAWDDCENL